MRYSTPELVVVGTATALVQGIVPGELDHGGSFTSRPVADLALGLDE